ncbi:MAG: HAD family hydrolase [Ignavibacteriaceae bacterium]|nr:HAD family hydrolase [Ignavibacteriaceae bacterium]
MLFNAIIFDLDGTLLNTLGDISDSVNRILSREGFPNHNEEKIRSFIGHGTKSLILNSLPPDKRDNYSVQNYLDAFLIDYSQNYYKKTFPYNGITEMLDELTKKGIVMAVFTNKPDSLAKDCINKLLPEWKFEVILGSNDSFPLKPDPAGALYISEKLNIQPAEFLFLGDSVVDIKTGLSAGMFPVGALWGFQPDELIEYGAQSLIKDPMEIIKYLT